MDIIGILNILTQLGLFGALIGFILTIHWDRKKEDAYEKKVKDHIIRLFKDEINDNYDFVSGDQYILRQHPMDTDGLIVGYKIPRTGAWQLMMGNDGLKYLDPELVYKISIAYVQLFDFNDFLVRMNSFYQSLILKHGMSIPNIGEPFTDSFKRLKNDALSALKDAKEELEKYSTSS